MGIGLQCPVICKGGKRQLFSQLVIVTGFQCPVICIGSTTSGQTNTVTTQFIWISLPQGKHRDKSVIWTGSSQGKQTP